MTTLSEYLDYGYIRQEVWNDIAKYSRADFVLHKSITDSIGTKYEIIVLAYKNSPDPTPYTQREFILVPTAEYLDEETDSIFVLTIGDTLPLPDIEKAFENFWINAGKPYMRLNHAE